MSVSVSVCYVFAYVYIRIYLYVYKCVYIYAYVCVYIYIYVYIYICICICIYIYICVCVCVCYGCNMCCRVWWFQNEIKKIKLKKRFWNEVPYFSFRLLLSRFLVSNKLLPPSNPGALKYHRSILFCFDFVCFCFFSTMMATPSSAFVSLNILQHRMEAAAAVAAAIQLFAQKNPHNIRNAINLLSWQQSEYKHLFVNHCFFISIFV